MASRDDQWSWLWKKEKTTCQEYTGHRYIMDWDGYTDGQEERRKEAWHWIDDQIAAVKGGKDQSDSDSETKGRIDYMQAVIDGYQNLHWEPIPDYPRIDARPDEAAYIRERAFYCSFFKDPENTPPYDAQQGRKKQNFDWINSRRQHIINGVNGEDGATPGWDVSDRRQRYDNLNIANHYGDQYADWLKGKYVPVDARTSGSGWRDKSANWHDGHLGITESPANSNCDSRSDGIRTSQDGCANGTWLRNQPWCGCWAWSGLYAAGKVKKGDSWLASVASIEDYAKAGKGPFKGWTTDGSKAKKGDLVVLFGRGQHVGTVRSVDSSYCHTWEGNTSAGSGGSQSNGGGSYKRDRSRSSETYGYALVKD